MAELHDPVSKVPGVGMVRAAALRCRGIQTVEDLLLQLPFRYEDRSKVSSISELIVGESYTFNVKVNRIRRLGHRGRNRVEAVVSDETGELKVVWFRQPYVADAIAKGDPVSVFGKVVEHDGNPQLVNPILEKGDGLHLGRLVPIYRRIGKLTPGVLRRLIDACIDLVGEVPESLPGLTRRRLQLAGRHEAVVGIHRPTSTADPSVLNAARSPAHQRLVCEEFLSLQTVLQLQRTQEKNELLGPEMIFDEASVAAILEVLPFRLTRGQDAALWTILADMKSRVPMHRLLQGDVGCGKTAVAGGALLAAATAGYQAAIMVPTELLARQHSRWLAPWAGSRGVNMECLTGTTSSGSKQRILDGLANGDIKILVGTHALLEPEVLFPKLGLAVIDEQHRFGVRQRASLREKGRADHHQCPHLLVMTATPIPRTLELTVYGDLDVCTINDMPPGRQPVVSQVVPAANWSRVVEMLVETVHRGEQAYVVAPRIKEGDDELSAAVQLQAELQRQLSGVRIGLLHGRQPQDERSSTMESFRAGQIDVLASTTVVEVGVDVTNATLMVIGHAERFGLAQLHQLRGRVGRGSAQATCVFLAHEPLSKNAQLRLEAVQSTTDGFELAEKDLSLRGPGELLGTRQAGVAGLRVGDLFRDHEWLEVTCKEARRLVVAEDDESVEYCQRIRRSWGRRFAMTQTG
tara:strand:+ start:8063 stop:10135 length:2073 start_codon:yes stop_codon:yes gene_type:complete